MMMMGDEPPKGVGQEPTLEGQNPEASGSADRPLSGGLRPLAEQHTDLGRDQIHRRPVSNRRQQASSLLLPPLSQAHARAAHVARRVSLATTCSASAHTPTALRPPLPQLLWHTWRANRRIPRYYHRRDQDTAPTPQGLVPQQSGTGASADASSSCESSEAEEEEPSLVSPIDLAASGGGHFLILFAGDDERRDGLPQTLRRQGAKVTAVDTKIGGEAHNVRRTTVRRRFEAEIAAGVYDGVFLGTPCESFSVAHKPQLRSRKSGLRGLANAPAEWRAYLAKHNELADWSAEVIRIAARAGVPWAVENPADRGDEASDAYWEKFLDHAPLWLQRDYVAIREELRPGEFTFPQCAFGAEVQKYTTIWCDAAMESFLRTLRVPKCSCSQHAAHAYGRNAGGMSRAELAAAYPAGLSDALATAFSRHLAERRRLDARRAAARPRDGLVSNGIALSPAVEAACDLARVAPPRFASMRNKRAATAAELATEPLPNDLYAAARPTKPKGRKSKGRKLPPPSTGGEAECDAQTVRPAGKITIWMLFAEGLYEREVVQGWIPLACAAATAIEEGRQAPQVPMLRIPQSRMPAWARGVIWDTRNPFDCVELLRSTRDTVFPGARQLDRAALRKAAAEVDWQDADILGQVGEGGVEVRSDCSLDTVLVFHHRGLANALSEARKVIDAHQREEWVSAIFEHLPTVPCRTGPRNVIMQDRVRLAADGTLESYLKPRVTADGSNGDEESMNAGCPPTETGLTLPTVQLYGRGLAIASVAADDCNLDLDAIAAPRSASAPAATPAPNPQRGQGTRVGGYAIDLESAYSFCVVQRGDWWLLVFVWWSYDRATGTIRLGFSIDFRMGFGGAFAPNRFERITRMVGAWIQMHQGAFDASQPYTLRARRFVAMRQRLQLAGWLPAGEGQLHPRHLQVYLDDYNGGALNDPVRTPEELQGVKLDTQATALAGGTPAEPGTRIYVHAQIALQRLRRLGFVDSEGKTCIGDPIGSLGFQVDIGCFRIRCPARKRATMLLDISAQASRARVELRVECKAAATLVGRLTNLSQIFPELKLYLHAGHRVAHSNRVSSSAGARSLVKRMRAGGAAQLGWLCLLEEASQLLDANEGVPLATQATPPHRRAAGVWTSTTDASGIDGLGGFVFIADTPSVVWVVSERWRASLLAALAACASQGSERARKKREGAHMLAMPAAELLAAWMVPDAVHHALREHGTAAVLDSIYAVGDCAPAVAALSSASGGNPQMRRALHGARALTHHWVSAHVKRELNGDADRLSHPSRMLEVIREAAAAGLTVREARITETAWAHASATAAEGVGGGSNISSAPAAKRKRRKR